MQTRNIRFGIVGIFILLVIRQTHEKKQVKITNFICTSLDEKIGVFLQCEIKAIKRDVSSMYIRYQMYTVIHDNLKLNLYLKKRGNVRDPTVYNFSIDACDFMEHRNKYPIAYLAYKIMGFEDYSNLNHTCPFQDEIILKDYRMKEEYINLLPIAYGQYRASAKAFYHTKQIVYFEFAFHFYERDVDKNETFYRPI